MSFQFKKFRGISKLRMWLQIIFNLVNFDFKTLNRECLVPKFTFTSKFRHIFRQNTSPADADADVDVDVGDAKRRRFPDSPDWWENEERKLRAISKQSTWSWQMATRCDDWMLPVKNPSMIESLNYFRHRSCKYLFMQKTVFALADKVKTCDKEKRFHVDVIGQWILTTRTQVVMQ